MCHSMRPWLLLLPSAPFIHRRSRLRPHSRDWAEPPYSLLSKHDRTADVYEACQKFTCATRYVLSRPLTRSRATSIGRCSHVKITLNVYAHGRRDAWRSV